MLDERSFGGPSGLGRGGAPKRHIPRLSTRTLNRDRLPVPQPLQSARERDQGTVVLVAGAVGAGKTSLLSSWSAQLLARGDGVGWASLGREDNDPHVLWGTVLDAVRDATARRPGVRPLPAGLGDWDVPVDPDPDFVGRVASAVATTGDDIWLLLDDVHVVRDPRCLETLDLLLRWAPANLHVVLGARADPALRIARLRIEGRLAEVRDHDLRFTVAETASLLLGHGIALSQGQLATLHRLTEGWAAGVGLAALSLSTGRDPDAFLRAFASDDGAMAGYLIDEVLGGLSEDRRDFLLATCVPERLTVELAGRLSGRDDAGAVLRELAATNSLVTASTTGLSTHGPSSAPVGAGVEVDTGDGSSLARTTDETAGDQTGGDETAGAATAGPVDFPADGADELPEGIHEEVPERREPEDIGAGTSYRYHALLRSYLRARLQAASLSRSSRMHAETAVWFAERDLAADALDHAVASGRAELVRGMLHRYALGLLLDGRFATVGRALTRAPEDVRRQPAVVALAALTSLESGDLGTAEMHLAALARAREVTDEAAAVADEPHVAYEPLPVDRLVALAHHHAARLAGRPDPGATEVSATGWDSGFGAAFAPNLRDLELMERIQTAITLLSRGRTPEAAVMLESAMETAIRTGHDHAVMACKAGLAGAAAVAGDLDAMEQWALRAIAYASPRGWAASPKLLMPYVLAASAAHERYDLTRAGRLIDLAAAILDGAGPTVGGRTPRQGIDLDPEIIRGVRSVAASVGFALAEDDPARRRDIVTARAESIAELGPVTGPTGHAPLTAPLAAYELTEQHRMALMTGQLTVATAVEHLAALRPELEGDLAVMRALHALRLGHQAEARAQSSPVTSGLVVPMLVTATISAWLVEVTVALRNDQPTVAHEALLTALDLAAPRHGIRILLQVSSEVVDALREARGRFGKHEDFVDEALAVAGRAAGEERTLLADGLQGAPLLSPRELSLLRDLPSMLTVAEIARARAVSPNTIKTQLRSLFEKLDVTTRRDAVATGRRAGLI
ncbi:hypothetical protein N865_04835 [Intrasporangium oryzae NRRL B-24470]|uniref:HTH luxR-type domain-containing protein n=1 Tax=Intrasporangium oryzae NRRL B-24470 TaxID=1386089 RepID=W9G917_9MICO|nr:LuxR C-terminal-related transcriptional regulator [Intrasporangium oryzae]EWT02510.1 hypothetical protein N865_04835 [Intrasporangium oryzae NRRL B-24470]